MSQVLAVSPVVADHEYTQESLARQMGVLVTSGSRQGAVLRRVHARTGVQRRHLALPLADYEGLSFAQANARFVSVGGELAARAGRAALSQAGLEPGDVDVLVFTTVTGVGAPALDVDLVGRLGMRRDVRRVPSFGWGCAGGVAGLATLDALVSGTDGRVGLLVSVELCSLTLQRGDGSMANVVASGLFADGGAALVAVGGSPRARSGVGRVVGAGSVLYPGTDHLLGWQVRDSGFSIVLDPGLPVVIEEHVAADVGAFLARHGLTVADVAGWVVHPGGPRILDAVAEGLGLGVEALAASRRSLQTVGNLSSASVLHVLADVAAQGVRGPVLMMAFGPGVGMELALVDLAGGR